MLLIHFFIDCFLANEYNISHILEEGVRMKDFPDFMKNKLNRINPSQQNTPDIDGYYYEGADGSQICFWTYFSDRESKESIHEFDEYVICVCGE